LAFFGFNRFPFFPQRLLLSLRCRRVAPLRRGAVLAAD